jgi:xanthine dehydrogenase accessory factor
MRDILPDLLKWRQADKPIAVATVVETWGSAPREIGAKMAFTAEGAITGSVSGGCVEGAVFEIGSQVLAGETPRLVEFGVADETAWDVGLACGGKIRVFIQRLNEDLFYPLVEALNQDKLAVKATVTGGPAVWVGREVLYLENDRQEGSVGRSLDVVLRPLAAEVLRRGKNQHLSVGIPSESAQEAQAGSEISIIIEAYLPPPTVVMVGGVHIAIALTSLAKTLGYRTVVIDPRQAFGNTERFSEADMVISAWPDEAFDQISINESTAVAMLTHDPKIDDPALKIVLPSKAFYVGALGSRGTQKKRRERLLGEGIPVELLDRIHGPIGLPLGGRTPEEIALAIMAQITAARHKE